MNREADAIALDHDVLDLLLEPLPGLEEIAEERGHGVAAVQRIDTGELGALLPLAVRRQHRQRRVLVAPAKCRIGLFEALDDRVHVHQASQDRSGGGTGR
jgi:hypothetical protein